MALNLLTMNILALSDETVVELHEFLHTLLKIFEEQYTHQIQRYKETQIAEILENLPDGQDPF